MLLYFVLLLALAWPAVGLGATYYVAASGGNDGNSCAAAQNSTTPRQTATAGAACLAPGDTLIIKNGTYHEYLADVVPSGISAGQPTILRAENNRQAIFDTHEPGQACIFRFGVRDTSTRNYITIDGIVFAIPTTFAGGAFCFYNGNPSGAGDWQHDIQVLNNEVYGGYNTGSVSDFTTAMGQGGGSHHFTFRNNYIHDIGVVLSNGSPTPPGMSAYSYGMYISGHHNTIENNEIARTSGYGFHGYSSHTEAEAPGVPFFDYNIIRNNYFHDTGGPLLFACGGSNNQIYNNIVARTGIGPAPQRGGIVIGTTCTGIPTFSNQIYHNTIIRTVGSGCERGITLSCSGLVAASSNTVRNNILWQNSPDDTISNGSSGAGTNVIDRNLSGVDPLLVATIPNSDLAAAGITALSFQIQSASPGHNPAGGISVGVTTDYGGLARDATPDLGAWEFGGVTPVATAGITWTMNECAGTSLTDMSGNGITGTLVASPTWAPGREGLCSLGLNDTSQYATNAAVTWPAGTPVTVSFWINARTCAAGCGTLHVGFLDWPDRFAVHVPWADGLLDWDYGDSRGPGRISTDFTPYLNKWTFVALVSNGTNFKAIYLNGQLITSGTTADAPHVQLTGLDLGRWHTGTVGPFYANADIDLFQLENQVLTAQQIQDRYRATAGRPRHTPMGLR